MNAWITPAFALPAGLHVLTTLRHGLGDSRSPFDQLNLGSRSGDDPAVVARNRDALQAALKLPRAPHWLQQVHGIEVAQVSGDPEREPVADASVTDQPGTVLAILTADCLPVALFSKHGDNLGLAHAGWRGLAAGVLEATVASMGTEASVLTAWLGPAAGPGAYEIGEEVRSAFVDADAGAADAFVATRPGHWRVDLYALARRRLAAVGVTEVQGGDYCTISDPRFFSHRRDARTGRMATLAWVDP